MTNTQSPPTLEKMISPPSIDQLNEVVSILHVFAVVKGFMVVFLLVYIIISAVIIKQIYLMTNTIKGPSNQIIILLGYANLIIAILIFVIVLFIS